MCHDLSPDECVSIYNDEMRKARKEHRCVECHRVIKPGEAYRYEFGIYEHEAAQYKTCAHCSAAREWLRINCETWIYADVFQDLYDHFTDAGAYPPADRMWLGRVVVGMKRQWDGGKLPVPKPARALPTGMHA